MNNEQIILQVLIGFFNVVLLLFIIDKSPESYFNDDVLLSILVSFNIYSILSGLYKYFRNSQY